MARHQKGKKEKPAMEEPTFSSIQDFEEKMFPRTVASRSLRQEDAGSRDLGQRLADALAKEVEERLPSNGR